VTPADRYAEFALREARGVSPAYERLSFAVSRDDDLLALLGDLVPADDRWRHAHGSKGHGRSHVMPALVPPYATVPVDGGQLALGTWQSICLVDLNVDNADRKVRLDFLSG
jgi:thiamine phosphate synthase YjbQ (UPF0047 family)